MARAVTLACYPKMLVFGQMFLSGHESGLTNSVEPAGDLAASAPG